PVAPVAPPPAPAAPAPAPPAGAAGAEAVRQELDELTGRLGLDHFTFLGVTVDSSAAEVKDAYMRLARRFHPDTHHDPALVDLRDRIVRVFVRAGQAW